ncbi:MAG: alkaline phosphatase D family protein [Halioglobus sp.]
MPVSRRTVLGLLSSSTFLLTAGSLGATITSKLELPLSFPQGVASADPQPSGVMLWTRAVPADDTDDVVLQLQVSLDSNFSQLVLQETISTSREHDFTVRAFVGELEPDTRYYYRFIGGADSVSRTGRTRTAPAPGQERAVNMAFASCQSYEQGYYGSWARMLADDKGKSEDEQIDLVLHLGDFIYERSWPHLANGSPVPRPLPSFPDGAKQLDEDKQDEYSYAVTLADYRHLYKTYLSDPYLQEARARWPFVCTWDDHEFSNDNFQTYTTYGEEPVSDGKRKIAANRAWFEFIPAVLDELEEQPAHDFKRNSAAVTASDEDAVETLCIYRRLNWGKYLDILLTDSRSYRSGPCLTEGFAESLGLVMNSVTLVEIADAGADYDNGNPPATLPYADGSTPNPGKDRAPGSLLGATQRSWLLAELEGAGAQWKLWGNALPLVPMRLDLSSLPFTDYEDSIFHLDAWAGYPHEVSMLMQHVQAANITGLVSFSGDHHMHGAGTLKHNASDAQAKPVAVDFSIAGISSEPMFEELYKVSRSAHPDFAALVYRAEEGKIIPTWNMSMLDGALASLAYSKTGLRSAARWLGPNSANPGLRYLDATANGYGLARFSEDQLQVDMVTMESTITPFEKAPEIKHVARFELPLWSSQESPVLSEPQFRLGAPFPFAAPDADQA